MVSISPPEEKSLKSGPLWLHLKKRMPIVGWVQAGLIVGIHLGTPCNTFSFAHDARPGPPPLRSNERPLGLGERAAVGLFRDLRKSFVRIIVGKSFRLKVFS